MIFVACEKEFKLQVEDLNILFLLLLDGFFELEKNSDSI